jgi:hypothetical protein
MDFWIESWGLGMCGMNFATETKKDKTESIASFHKWISGLKAGVWECVE